MNLGPARVLDPMTRDAIVSLLRRNNKIAAIKMYRMSTAAGLLEAKNAVEAIAAQNGIVTMAGAPGGSAAFPFTTLLLFALAVVVGIAIYFTKFVPH